MTHGGFGERFYSRGQSMWHGLGIVNDRDQTAVETLEMIGGYEVTIEPLYTSSGIPVKLGAIVRHPTHDDPEPKILGTCSPDYPLIPPREAAEIWDEVVKAPVETMGALFDGSTLYITTKLPTIDVRGDEVRNFLLFVSPMTGTEALRARNVSERVVCANTLRVAEATAGESYRVVHDRHARIKIRAALEGLYNRAVNRVGRFTEIFNLMADRRLTPDEVSFVIDTVYTIEPAPQVEHLPPEIAEQRLGSWELNASWTTRRRQAVREIFDGAGVGSNTPAYAGTAWGLYNAIQEAEQYLGRTRGVKTVVQDMISGYRGRIMERGYEVVATLVTGGKR